MHCTVTKPSRHFPYLPSSIIKYKEVCPFLKLQKKFSRFIDSKTCQSSSKLSGFLNFLWYRKGPGFWLLQESGLPLLLQSIAIIRLWNLPRSVAYFLCAHTVLYCKYFFEFLPYNYTEGRLWYWVSSSLWLSEEYYRIENCIVTTSTQR